MLRLHQVMGTSILGNFSRGVNNAERSGAEWDAPKRLMMDMEDDGDAALSVSFNRVMRRFSKETTFVQTAIKIYHIVLL